MTDDGHTDARAWLMRRIQCGDREAYRELLDDVGPMLLRFIRRRVSDAAEVEDVYQDTLMALHRARHTYEPSRPLEPWLFAIARHAVIDHARRRCGRAAWEVLVDALPERPADVESAGIAHIAAVLGRLPSGQREAFTMLKLEGLTAEEAAARAGVRVGALKVRAHRAYRALRVELAG